MKRLPYLAVAVAALAWPTAAIPCSDFTAHDGQTVLVGNNEDFSGESPTILWFVPAESGKHGYVAWGYESNHFAQGGMNDQGLFFDGFATAAHTLAGDTGSMAVTKTTLEEMLQQSATVDEAIAFLRQYKLTPILRTAQLFFVDRNGDSAIFEGDVVTKPTTSHQVVTNFLPSRPELGGFPCWRYVTLEHMMRDGFELSVEYFAKMAEAVHQGLSPASAIFTRYTTIADLTAGTFRLYHGLDYSRFVRFDLNEELAKGPHEIYMVDLFPVLPVAQPPVVDSGPPKEEEAVCQPKPGCSSVDGLTMSGLAGVVALALVLRRRSSRHA